MTTKKTTTGATAAKKAAAANLKAASEQKAKAAATVGVTVSAGEIEKARKEGAIAAEKDAAKDSYQYATDGNLPGEGGGQKYPGKSEIMQYAHLINLGADEFEAAIAENADVQIAEDKVAGLLELERSGQNRTPYVQACCKRLKVANPYEVTSAGPGYTNDVRPISAL